MIDDSNPECAEKACGWALDHLQEFLHGELSDEAADAFRHHLTACESCMDEADMEAAVSRALRRCQQPVHASIELRMRIVGLTLDS
ncbi:MAG: zf-HC2 domain-containing protein [Acidipropionibacterium acidipropionici]|jgi:anti-sigma factor (TIGR02949 family)|uniref:Anti-sigma factor n=1 Tax=Acidipropionibacterium acidipropionici TaxID=1748 RepID=A0A142KE15_9ACTN|nr:zf-HC2 domain-containing protein [Acidipropionibacterium acidipropionici]ALN15860.1 anti-sigma factor [Acidipropionibacterium acidipropionici]AMS04353.1 anti-sigma factor [Acidipropionibacterium acidipropionici]AOZ45847.1 mycothiol system anti-sigma-R factor [Acidipropionibacterium acidipropionici]APZ08394.1 mycothiol system anti-sigma-R factor [Acidipropionibacterium acidipropionici]AZP38136.1 mycothiol system anti-sigma-R factor [Acidipropionibacterium acidipropionici]